ncbi:peptide/nickel transport system permease protein [Gemmobacter megaterium]|uniref:Peptide/nickel transport system permease protein n=1 Tax=Gemmobacter megaterium TaxID=1086013 RepID=A0A1N7P6A6_9RHOB|nr:ABC transporter permease [Gemmobacter megaterium]GGE20205.1 ABC transporter substrate-binding protein [Gemmobacter megaterium]SIT06175.1 peptide/nickel transport system permease protein [Gemmobacter megaterium]
MLTFAIRRILLAIPTLIFISLVLFLLLEAAPGDPLADMPLTIPPEVREKIRLAMGLGEPWYVRYVLWLNNFFVTEPLYWVDSVFGTDWAQGKQRILSYQTRSPVFDTISERLPQTLLVVGTGMLVGILIAIPIGVISAYRQYSWFDQLGTFISMIGFSIPTFVTGVVLIVIFAVWIPNSSPFWLPTIYDTTLRVQDWDSFIAQVRQMILPVTVLALYYAAQISRYMRSSMLDNLGQDYVRTARAKGLTEKVVVLIHVLRNSMIPVVTVITLLIPGVFTGAIITETIFKVNGIGQQLLLSLQGNDAPMVMTITFIFAVLIVAFNLIADVLYGLLDPRIRYD